MPARGTKTSTGPAIGNAAGNHPDAAKIAGNRSAIISLILAHSMQLEHGVDGLIRRCRYAERAAELDRLCLRANQSRGDCRVPDRSAMRI